MTSNFNNNGSIDNVEDDNNLLCLTGSSSECCDHIPAGERR